MNKPPSDWNEDQELWNLLGKSPKEDAGSNFLYLVRQKLTPEPKHIGSNKRFSWFQGWVGGLSTAAACLLVLAVFLPKSPQNTVSSKRIESFELASLAQNYELIQDLEVIEKLDEL
jgi:hypothetical protein